MENRPRCRFALAAFLATASMLLSEPTKSPAVDARDSTAIAFRLQEVVVVGTQDAEAVIGTTLLQAEDLERLRPASTAEMLRRLPSLTVTSGPKAETETRLRGFPAGDVLVLVDGRPINPGYYGKVDLAMLPVENIQKITVVKGPGSAAYGPNGMGGVINVVTRNGLGPPRTVIDSEFGDYEYRRIGINHNRRIGKWNYWISGYEMHSNGSVLSDDFEATGLEDGGLRDHSAYRKRGGDAKVGYQPKADELYALSVGYHWAEKDVPATIYAWDSPTFRVSPTYERINSALSGSRAIARGMDLKGVIYLDAYNDRLIDYSGAEMRDDQILWDSKLENWTSGGSADLIVKRCRSHAIQSGVSFKRDLMNKRPDVEEPWTTEVLYTGNVYIHDELRLNDRAEITAGIAQSVFRNDGAAKTSTDFSPTVSAAYRLKDHLTLEGGAGRAVRYPTLHWLYGETSGNPELEPEKADKFEAGFISQLLAGSSSRSISVRAVFFHNELHDLIYRESRDNIFRNIGSAQLQGWEVEAEIKASQYLFATASFTRLDPKRCTAELMEEVSPNRLNLLIGAGTRFGLDVTYELSTFDNRATYVEGFTLYPYELHNVTASQDVNRHLTLHLKLRNLTDVAHEEELGYPGAGREVRGGVTYSL